jgi:hypothetical protein
MHNATEAKAYLPWMDALTADDHLQGHLQVLSSKNDHATANCCPKNRDLVIQRRLAYRVQCAVKLWGINSNIASKQESMSRTGHHMTLLVSVELLVRANLERLCRLSSAQWVALIED